MFGQTQPKFITTSQNPGTVQQKSGKAVQLYSRELSNAKMQLGQHTGLRGTSSHSQGGDSRFNPRLQNQNSADNTSLVRQALKNQKRNQKIVVMATENSAQTQ